MVIDDQFIKNYAYQIKHLERMKKSIEDAIKEAQGFLDKMTPGARMVDIFGIAPPQERDTAPPQERDTLKQ